MEYVLVTIMSLRTCQHSEQPDGVLQEEILIRGTALTCVARCRVDESLLGDYEGDADHKR